jgi:alpha 1,2-mannosyltransferase
MHSRFQEILFLDADNVPVSDPSFLFDSEEFRSTGTVFWPDPEHFYTPRSSPCWGIFGTPYRPCPDQESGQLMVDKERCWKALQLCNWYNERSDFFYQHVYGDKETFRYAWQRLGLPITWPSRFASEEVRFTLCQHDFAGHVLFQHRFYRKWSLYGQNFMTNGFQLEDLCLQFLDELRVKWHPQRHLMRNLMTDDLDLMSTIGGRR